MNRSRPAGAAVFWVWTWPAVLAGATVLGLGSALLGDGPPWRWLSWLMLAAPLLRLGLSLGRAWSRNAPHRSDGVARATRPPSRANK